MVMTHDLTQGTLRKFMMSIDVFDPLRSCLVRWSLKPVDLSLVGVEEFEEIPERISHLHIEHPNHSQRLLHIVSHFFTFNWSSTNLQPSSSSQQW